MNVPNHMEITASLMAGYRFEDGSLIEVDAAGDYRITDAEGVVIAETVDTSPGSGLQFGTRPNDYGDIMDDLAAFLQHDAELIEMSEYGHIADETEYLFGYTVAAWARDHEDELSMLAFYMEDKRLGEGMFAEEV